jgi:NADH-quinone oxidoreductase subunit H
VFVLLFLGGWNPLPWVPLAPLIDTLPVWLGGLIGVLLFLGKVFAFIFLFMWIRWTLPRFRYDQVMQIGWQKLLPLSIGNLIFYAIAIAIIERSS